MTAHSIQELFSLSTDACVGAIQSMPPDVDHLKLAQNGLNSREAKDLIAMFRVIHPQVRTLDLSRNGKMLPDVLAAVFPEIPVGVDTLILANFFIQNDTAEIIHALRALPPHIKKVSLAANKFCDKTPSQIISILSALPISVTEVNLYGNFLNTFSPQKLQEIVSNLPPHLQHIIFDDLLIKEERLTLPARFDKVLISSRHHRDFEMRHFKDQAFLEIRYKLFESYPLHLFVEELFRLPSTVKTIFLKDGVINRLDKEARQRLHALLSIKFETVYLAGENEAQNVIPFVHDKMPPDLNGIILAYLAPNNWESEQNWAAQLRSYAEHPIAPQPLQTLQDWMNQQSTDYKKNHVQLFKLLVKFCANAQYLLDKNIQKENVHIAAYLTMELIHGNIHKGAYLEAAQNLKTLPGDFLAKVMAAIAFSMSVAVASTLISGAACSLAAPVTIIAASALISWGLFRKNHHIDLGRDAMNIAEEHMDSQPMEDIRLLQQGAMGEACAIM